MGEQTRYAARRPLKAWLAGWRHVVSDGPRSERLLLLVALLFVGLQSATYAVVAPTRAHPLVAVWFAAITTIAYLLLRRGRPVHDPFLFPVYVLFTGWSLVLQDRLAPGFFGRQAIWVTLGMAVVVACAVLPRSLEPLRRYRTTILLVGAALLAATLIFGVNPSGAGAALWLPVPLVPRLYFQPSELLKLLFIIFLASYFSERELLLNVKDGRRRQWIPHLMPVVVIWALCLLLLVWQQDLGAAMLFFLLFLALLYVATGSRLLVLIGAGLMVGAGVVGYFAFDVVALRVDAWLNPWPEFDDRAFQIVQSLYALGSGGLIGRGIGQGFPTYIPVVHSDFALAAVAEEWGLVGALAVITGFLVLTARGTRIALRQSSRFALFVALGITVIIMLQTLLIMGGVTKLLPLTGVTLPFLSYGGSSLLLVSVMLGMLLWLSGTEAPTHDG